MERTHQLDVIPYQARKEKKEDSPAGRHSVPGKKGGEKLDVFPCQARKEERGGRRWGGLSLSLIHISEPTRLRRSRMPSSA